MVKHDDQVKAHTFDKIGQVLTPDIDTVWMELGGRGHFAASDVVHASEALHTAIGKLTSTQTLILSIGGYDADPRELWAIPEALTFILRVMKQAGIMHWQHPAVRMLNESTLALLLKCGAFGTDHPFKVSIAPGKPVSFGRYERKEV